MGGTGTTPQPQPLSQAISDFEWAQTALNNADGAQSAAQAKLDAAKASLEQTAQADKEAVANYNDSADALIAALRANKRPVAP